MLQQLDVGIFMQQFQICKNWKVTQVTQSVFKIHACSSIALLT